MKLSAIICTRDKNQVSETTDTLVSFLSSCGISVYLVCGAKSIFSAYKDTFDKINPDDEEGVIFCHDDIEIREDKRVFREKIERLLDVSTTGFIGPAGTSKLGENAVWWDSALWQQGFHKGLVYHIAEDGKEYATNYGPPGPVVVLDGLFLAARAKTIRDVGLEKPEYFDGDWDFYDIYYTSVATEKGYTNKILDITILHHSRGELVGRVSWEKNRVAFIKENNLPLLAK